MLQADKTIFYVDDNSKARRLLASVLTGCGFSVICSGDPIEAHCRMSKTSFDLALIDYQMPKLSGGELAQRVKRVKPDIPIVLISGYTSLPPVELLFVDAHVGRGATLDELLQTIHSLTRPHPVILKPGAPGTPTFKLPRAA
jgi:CheY-like chemotaxis protein